MKCGHFITAIIIIELYTVNEINRSRKFIVKIFLCPFPDLCKIEFAPPRQFILSRIVEQDAVAFDLRFEIVRLGQRMIELVDSVVDELGVCMKRSVFILEKAVFDFRVERILNRADLLAGQNEQVVVAQILLTRS